MASALNPGTIRRRNRKGEGSRLRDELVQAAMRILDSAPGTQLSLRMVAREAGVAAPSVYPHFADARTMMSVIVRECWSQLAAEMTRATKAPSLPDARAVLNVQMGAYVHYAMQRPSRYQLLFAMHPIDSDEEQDLPGLIQPAFRQVRATLQVICDSGGTIPGEDSFSAALMIMSLVHGRIALAHLAPWREGNSSAGVEAFVSETLGRLLSPST